MSKSTETRGALIRALAHASDGEHRFGQRQDVRAELDQRWERVIDLLLELVKRGQRNAH